MKAYPGDELYETLRNVFDFDVYGVETTEKLDEVLRKHGSVLCIRRCPAIDLQGPYFTRQGCRSDHAESQKSPRYAVRPKEDRPRQAETRAGGPDRRNTYRREHFRWWGKMPLSSLTYDVR